MKAPNCSIFYRVFHPRQLHRFLQHGITENEMEWMHRKNMYIDLFVCGAKPEYEYIRDTFGYPEHVPQYVGLARFDNLIRAERKEKMILVMPTWRGSHYPTGEAFRNTAYYEHFQSLLCCKELEQLLEQYDYRLVFYPHVEMQKDSRMFESGSDRITIVSKETHDVQKLLMDCALLVTDYSSVFFDVAFLRKPVVYYQFDEEEFRKYHYQKGYFDFRRDGFGPVCTTQEALLEALTDSFENGMEMSVHTTRLLPLESGEFEGGAPLPHIRFEPSAEEVLAKIVPAYITGFLYSAMVHSFCAEQNARASAMDAANRNEDDMLRELQFEYNHERQSAITSEITEVSAGARSRQNRMRKEAQQHAHG